MSKLKKVALLILASFIFGLFCLWASFFILDVATGSYAFRRSFKSIQPGASRDEVVAKLGEPHEESKDPFYGEFIVYENPPLESFRIKSHYYLVWFCPGSADEIYSIGFDGDNKVVGTVYGSS